MKTIKIEQNKNKKKNKILDKQVELIVRYLKRGKVIVYPTDTIYGLGCIATNKKAINRIYKIKKREKKKPLLILVSSMAMLKKYCYVSKEQEEYLKNVWKQERQFENPPNPPLLKGGDRAVSVILKSRRMLPKELTGGSEDIAVRLPKDELLIKMIGRVKTPIVSTSVNISGKRSLANISQVNKYFIESPEFPFNKGGILPDLVIDAGEISEKPSKLVDLRDLNNIKVLRK